jgi:hypothetical protein
LFGAIINCFPEFLQKLYYISDLLAGQGPLGNEGLISRVFFNRYPDIISSPMASGALKEHPYARNRQLLC